MDFVDYDRIMPAKLDERAKTSSNCLSIFYFEHDIVLTTLPIELQVFGVYVYWYNSSIENVCFPI